MHVAYEQVCSDAKSQKDDFSEVFYHKILKILPVMYSAC